MQTFVIIVISTIFLTLTFTRRGFSQELKAEIVSDECIGCICYASTGCKNDTGCTEAGVCGPLLISWPYWADGGKYFIKGTDPSSPNVYPQCAQDSYCAAQTVRGYMQKYGRDCNGDGRIECDDYARIHKRGPGSCADPNLIETKYYKEFSTCATQLHP